MSFRDWLSHPEIRRVGIPVVAYLAVIAGAVTLAIHFGPETGGKVHQDANDHRKFDKLSSVFDSLGNPRFVKYQHPCYETEDHDQADLCQQWRAANAAESTAETSWFWNLVQDGLTLAAVFYAARAAREATRASSTAEGTLRHAQESAEFELRARISVLPRGINPMIGKDHGMGHIAVKNIGKLPAHRVSIFVKMKISGAAEQSFPIPSDLQHVVRTLQPDTEMMEGTSDTIPISTFCTDRDYVYVWGVAYYDDGFNKRRFTRFCHRYHTAKHMRQWPLVLAREIPNRPEIIISASEARYHTTGNDAD